MADRRKQLCDRADIAPIAQLSGPKLGMFRVEIENPPEEIKTTPGVEFVEEPETPGKFI